MNNGSSNCSAACRLADKARMHQKLGKLKQHLRERTES